MLSKISWNEFFTFLIIILVLYYCVILPKYYRKEIMGLFQKKKSIIKEPRSPV
ncbi:MAG TPA: hypothetical protein VK787_11295 [Puia sp.]|nr:hypothetical protein [Puia sp.]